MTWRWWLTPLALVIFSAATGSAETLEGRVVEDHTGNALASVEVRVKRAGSPGLVADVETNTEGHFRAPDLTAGEYQVEVSKPNYVGTALRLRLPADALQIRLVRLGVITGRVTDAEGQSRGGGYVFALVKPAQGNSLRRYGSPVIVDATGQYRLYNLPPGKYAVGLSYATFNPGGGSGVSYYPGTGEPQLFTVSGGEEYGGIDFAMLPGPRYRVTGKATGPASGVRFAISLFPAGQPALAGTNVWTEADGSFKLEGVQPGSYELAVSGPAVGYGVFESLLGPERLFGRIHLEVGGADIEGLSIPVSKGRSARFVLRVLGSQGACPSSAAVTLAPLEAAGSAESRTIEVSIGKEKDLENIAPGRYQVVVSKLGDGCFASSASLDLTEGDAPGVVPVEVAPAGSLRGRLEAGSAKPTDFAVVLVASESVDAAPAVQVAYPDSDSRFAFPSLHPGKYRIGTQPAGEASKARWVSDIGQMFEIEVPGGSTTDVELSPPTTDGERP